MCGICGIVYTDPQREVPPGIVERMNATLVHRGPDEGGHHIRGNVGLGHRRLSIIDLANGRQPLYNEDRSMAITYNGEIYNYRALKSELTRKGHVFATDCDTEAILHLYEEMGERCVERLRGMFAFAIYDHNRSRLFAARDRLGIKPLYYSSRPGAFAFASEIKAILECPDVSREVNIEALSDYLTYLYVPSPKSIFTAVRKLPAGHTLTVERGTVSVSRYWDVRFSPNDARSEDAWREELLETLRQSIEMRLISEVPLGAFLSGGLDSSLVVGIMAGLSADRVKTNSIGFKEASFSELPYAREVANLFATDHREYIVEMDSAGILDKLAWHYDEPFADSSALPTYYVCKMARENVTVALSGDGGDENFAGYRRYFYDVLENRLRSSVPTPLRTTLVRWLAGVYPKGDWLPQVLRARTLLTNLSMSPVEGYHNTMSHFLPAMRKRVLHRDLRAQLGGYDPLDEYKAHFDRAGTNDPLSRIQYTDMKTYLVDDILTKVDRASMANSLEVRVPILDHVLVECAASMPSHLKLRGREGKAILKSAASRMLPKAVIGRKKMGFSIPIDAWFRGGLRPMAEDEVFSQGSHCSTYFDMKELAAMWKDHQRGLRNYGLHFWAVLMLEKWARTFLKPMDVHKTGARG